MTILCVFQNGYPLLNYDNFDSTPNGKSSSMQQTAKSNPSSKPNETNSHKSSTQAALINNNNNRHLATRPPHHAGIRIHSQSAPIAETVAVREMVTVNQLSQNSASVARVLPKLVQKSSPSRIRPFHAQTQLYRTESDNKSARPQYFQSQIVSDSGSSESSESSSDD